MSQRRSWPSSEREVDSCPGAPPAPEDPAEKLDFNLLVRFPNWQPTHLYIVCLAEQPGGEVFKLPGWVLPTIRVVANLIIGILFQIQIESLTKCTFMILGRGAGVPLLIILILILILIILIILIILWIYKFYMAIAKRPKRELQAPQSSVFLSKK